MQPPLAVSMGDPCGVGPDILLMAWQQRKQLDIPDMVTTGNAGFLEHRAAALGLDISIQRVNSPGERSSGKLAVIEVSGEVTGIPGKPSSGDAQSTVAAIDKAVDLVSDGECSALVTCPINKDALYQNGFNHPGHTEYLAELAERSTGKPCHPVMMIAGPQLRTIPVTIHIPLSEVSQTLTSELIVRTVETAYLDLRRRFSIENPRIAVAGLNPHAGENGSLGKEDGEIILPALETLKSKGINAAGPLPADTMFHPEARARYDVAVCMYHDQALIPAKMIGFDDGVNVTLGLPFIRTSPDHGTAYDIAGTGLARISSFTSALNLAASMAAAD